ncbi:hypothetical protein MJO52_11740 [Microbulbifer variabilis]|uniref:Lipoprotein n=1 Tax=Microbulbifer variabilis TaxID=266805 RepID=A0ABY4V658_9GAMM|nr:hypothetical protein [Microbulbifer variabilis]USD19754.1 hypothetical protein MJO52_11740 [Microbulbifer variabilis]
MRVFKGLLTFSAFFLALTGCNDTMKESEIYPTIDNLLEVDANQLKIIEARNTDDGILIVIGESSNNRCDIQIQSKRLGGRFVYNSLEGQPESVKVQCQWNDNHFNQSRKNFTSFALRLEKASITVDLQLVDLYHNKYLAFTLIEAPLSNELKTTGRM